MAFFEWKCEYKLGVDLMDRDHEDIIRLAHELELGVASSADPAQLLALLNSAVEATRVHMQREEALLQQAGYPGLKHHRREHEDLLQALLEFRAKVEEGSATVCLSVLEFLSGWMGSHLRSEDRRAAEFLNRLAKAS